MLGFLFCQRGDHMATDYGVRQGLLSKGYSNDDIGYDQNTGYVQLKGQNFMKPEMNVQGTTYTSQDNFNNSYNQYNNQQKANQQQQFTDQYIQKATQAPTANPYNDQYSQLINTIMQKVNAPQQDVYSTPQYAAAQGQQQRAAQQGIRSAQEALGTAGFGRSTALGESANRAQNDANEYLQLQMVPQIQQQLAAQRQADINNQYSLLNPIYNQLTRQDTQTDNATKRIRDVVDLLGSQQQNDFNNDLLTKQDNRSQQTQDANFTGNYMPTGARDSINRILDLKRQAEAQGVNPDQMAQFKAAADKERAALAQMGVDPSIVGFDANYDQASQNSSNFKGIPTLQKQASDLNNTQVLASLTGRMPDGKPTTAEQQRQLSNLWMASEQSGVIANELANLYGIPPGTQTRAAKEFAQQLAISQQNADTSRGSLDWSKDSNNPDNQYKVQEIAKVKSELEQIGKTKPITTQDAINVLNKSPFVSEESTTDQFGNVKKTGKTQVDKTGMVQAIAGMGVPDSQMDALFNYYGISQNEVQTIEKQLRSQSGN
jgi:hypothetical protein